MNIVKPLLLGIGACALVGCASTGDKVASFFGFGPEATDQAKTSEAQGVAGTDSFSGEALSQGGASNQLPTLLHFGFNQYRVTGQDQEKEAHAVADYLLKNPGQHVLVSGYTDPIGSHEYNLHLGQRRADSLKDYFTKQGVSPSNVCTVSYGELYPVAQPENLKALTTRAEKIMAYASDRRVEFQYGDVCSQKADHATS